VRVTPAIRRTLGGIGLLVAGFAATTWWALESGGVAVIETRSPDGATRSTHVWYVEPDAELWVEAGTPNNGWFVDVRQRPELRFVAGDRSVACRARPVEGRAAHDRIRGLIREKYGFRDAWVGLLVDTSGSIAVRLDDCVAVPGPLRGADLRPRYSAKPLM